MTTSEIDTLKILHDKGHFTLWLSKSRGRGIEWPNFVESPKKWAEKYIADKI
jgi:hypothetical protein